MKGKGDHVMAIDPMFIDCPACGLPAEILDLYRVQSTEGPLESARVGCPRGHWFNGLLEVLVRNEPVRTLSAGMGLVPGRRASGY